MSAGTGNNHTPLNLNNLFDRYSKPQFATLGKNKGGVSSSNIPNLFLGFAVLLFVGAFSFSLTQSSTSTNTRASAIEAHVPAYLELNTSPFTKMSSYPKTFNGEEINQNIYKEGEEKYKEVASKTEVKQYITEQVAKYYIYKYVLGETTSTPVNSTLTFAFIESQVPQLEKTIFEREVSSVNFRYIYATFDDLPLNDDVMKKYSSKEEVKSAANNIVEKYKTRFDQSSSDPNSVIKEAMADTELTLLNNGADFIDVTDYTKESNFLDKVNLMDNREKFNNFVFSQQQNQASNIYTLSFAGKEYAYFVMFPYKVTTGRFESLTTLFNQNKDLFNY